jgi:protein-tyrosine phosphatase
LGDHVTVSSAGVRAREGHAAAGPSIRIAEGWGLDLRSHRSRPVTHELLEASDLLLTMAEEHRDLLSGRAAGVAERCFTLPELRRLLRDTEVAGLPTTPDKRISELAGRAHRRRPANVSTARQDVRDPYGRSEEVYAAVAGQLVELVGAVAPMLLGPVPADHQVAAARLPSMPSAPRPQRRRRRRTDR